MNWAAQNATDLSKEMDVKQSSEESLSAFLEWLYSPVDPEDLANVKAILLAFVTQLVTDICRKTPKMGGSELLEVAQKVMAESNEDVLIKKRGLATMAALQVPGTFNSAHAEHDKKRKPLQKNQYAYCKETNHWKKNERPRRKQVAPHPLPNPSQS